VRKKIKQPSFAAAISREDLTSGAESLGVDFDEHVANVISALAGAGDAVLPDRTGGEAAQDS
jgi:predicted hydrolase (HD superfamily)